MELVNCAEFLGHILPGFLGKKNIGSSKELSEEKQSYSEFSWTPLLHSQLKQSRPMLPVKLHGVQVCDPELLMPYVSSHSILSISHSPPLRVAKMFKFILKLLALVFEAPPLSELQALEIRIDLSANVSKKVMFYRLAFNCAHSCCGFYPFSSEYSTRR